MIGFMAAPQEQSNFRFHGCIGSTRASTCYTAASICRELLRLPHGWAGSTPMQRGLVLANLIYILQMEGSKWPLAVGAVRVAVAFAVPESYS